MEGATLSGLLASTAPSIGGPPVSLSPTEIAFLFLNSLLAGLVLTCLTYFFQKQWQTSEAKEEKSEKNEEAPKESLDIESYNEVMENIRGASNILFLCVGLTGMMVLINNNLIRAFAIIAAIALVRFRVKLSSSNTNAFLLFGVLSGMSFGVREVMLGWIMVGAYLCVCLVFHALLHTVQWPLRDPTLMILEENISEEQSKK